jgi:hypothetical protein
MGCACLKPAEVQFEDAKTVAEWVEAALCWLSLDQPGLVIAWLKL